MYNGKITLFGPSAMCVLDLCAHESYVWMSPNAPRRRHWPSDDRDLVAWIGEWEARFNSDALSRVSGVQGTNIRLPYTYRHYGDYGITNTTHKTIRATYLADSRVLHFKFASRELRGCCCWSGWDHTDRTHIFWVGGVRKQINLIVMCSYFVYMSGVKLNNISLVR